MEALRIFVSSTYDDLRAHRAAVADAIEGLEFVANDMVRWSADGRSPAQRSVEGVADSDVVVLLLAHQYGHVPDHEEHSFVELEYRAARSHGIPVLAFVLDDEVPWPPRYIEWEARERLSQFRHLVESEVTRATFRTTDDLARQVTQALATLAARRGVATTTSTMLAPSVSAATPSELRTQADAIVEIGAAEDGLPMLLDVRRSHDTRALTTLVDGVEKSLRRAGVRSSAVEFDTFRRAVERAVRERWSTDPLHDVTMLDGSVRRLFVNPVRIADTFGSCLAGLLREKPVSTGPDTDEHATSPTADDGGARGALTRSGPVGDYAATSEPPPAALVSTGGRNRFLAVDAESGTVHCVGSRAGGVVEWRPFVFEDPREALPSAELVIRHRARMLRVGLGDAADELARAAGSQGKVDGFGPSRVVTSRTDVLDLLRRIGNELQSVHDRDVVHGDVKPHNVLLGAHGPVLIDDFGVTGGTPSPGWTPGWSAPEQALGLPVTPTADVYPLGMMLARALGVTLVGEIRTYRGLPSDEPGTFELFHDPVAAFVGERAVTLTRTAASAWKRLIQDALRFDPDRRPDAAVFSRTVGEISADHPTPGRLGFVPTGRLVSARLVGGRDRIVRVIQGTDGAGAASPVQLSQGTGWRG